MNLPECYKDKYNVSKVETYIIPEGTILYSGSRKIPSEQNMKNSKSRYTYFSTVCDVGIRFATNFGTTNGYLTKYRVNNPLTIFLQRDALNTYYFDTQASYASEEAQCLCQKNFHGYASWDSKIGTIEDIGLCNHIFDGHHLEREIMYNITPDIKSCRTLSGGKRKRRTVRNKRRR